MGSQRLFCTQLIKVVFLSTSLVYAGDDVAHTEQDEPPPITEYGRQKVAVGKFINENFHNALILRLTKIFGVEKGDDTLFPADRLDRMSSGQTIRVAVTPQ